jgi:hypothetical protein
VIAIVCHDAGGAEILSSWLRKCDEPYHLVLEGPAKNIFQRKIGAFHSLPLADAIEQSDWVLCGTSWQSNLERQAIISAKAVGKKAVAFLDHWVNYEERFIEQGVEVCPDEIWVGDFDAEQIARTKFHGVSIVLKSNPYFAELRQELERVKSDSSNSKQSSVLYVCEPIREHAQLQHGDELYWGYTEEDALKFFINNIAALRVDIDKIIIRPHPSENRAKYDWVKACSTLMIETGGAKTLLEEIVEADIVIGCESMAMVVGLLANKRVISSIPSSGKLCSLPQRGIEHLKELVEINRKLGYV